MFLAFESNSDHNALLLCNRCLWLPKANLLVLAPAPQGVNAILPLLPREPQEGDLDVPMEPLQLGYEAAGLPAEGKFAN